MNDRTAKSQTTIEERLATIESKCRFLLGICVALLFMVSCEGFILWTNSLGFFTRLARGAFYHG